MLFVLTYAFAVACIVFPSLYHLGVVVVPLHQIWMPSYSLLEVGLETLR